MELSNAWIHLKGSFLCTILDFLMLLALLNNIKRRYWIICYVVVTWYSFPIRIPDFYTQYQSLYENVSKFPSKWTSFYSDPLLWVSNLELRTFRPSGGRIKTRGKGGFELVSSRRCAWCDFGTKDLLRQAQYLSRIPFQFPVPQGTWG